MTPRLFRGLAATWLSLMLAACEAGKEEPRDVLLVTIDTLRADFLGCYGSPFGLTPTLDGLAQEGVLFERHYTTAVYTGPSHATLLTGLPPEEHGVWRNGLHMPADAPRLSEAFAAEGYRTAAVIGSAVLGKKFGYDQGFEVFDEDLAGGPNGPRSRIQYQRSAEEVVARALDVLAAEDPRPLFLWVHLYDVHGPFTQPVPASVASAGLERLLPQLGPPASDGGPPAHTPERAAAVKLARGYGAAVGYVDREVGRLLTAFEAERGPRGIVAITSDHGEGLWEHGYDGHGLLLYEEAVQVPLLLRAPGLLPEDARVQGVTSSVDIAPALLLLAGAGRGAAESGLPLQSALMERLAEPAGTGGEAFQQRHAFRGDPSDEGTLDLLTALGTGTGEELALVRSRWKAIGDPRGELQLYDLDADPAEAVDVAAQEPAVLADLRARMLAREEALARREDGSGLTDEDTQRMLDDLGY